MFAVAVYPLPFLLGKQYMLSAVLSETADTVLYAAMQKDMRREVVVESLRPSAMQDSVRVKQFLDTARAQARIGGGPIASTLELLCAEDTWHIVRERVEGAPLDVMVAEGRKLPAATVCELMQMLCRICIAMDIEGLAGADFLLQHLYYMNPGFRLRNPALGGKRSRTSSRRVLTAAASDLLQLVDAASPFSAELCDIFLRMRYPSNWTPLSPLYYDEELVRLQERFAQRV